MDGHNFRFAALISKDGCVASIKLAVAQTISMPIGSWPLGHWSLNWCLSCRASSLVGPDLVQDNT